MLWGIDRLSGGQLSNLRRRLRGSDVAVLTHAAAVDRRGRHLLAVLEELGIQPRVVFTPGHSPGHVTYSVRDEDAIFSGDVLFQGSVGRVDLPYGDGPTLM